MVDVEVSSHACEVVLVVRDQGIGISTQDHALLFGEFFRSADSVALDRDGYGLGLSIVRRVVLRHGGRIGVESRRGATFRVVFPRAESATLNPTCELSRRTASTSVDRWSDNPRISGESPA